MKKIFIKSLKAGALQYSIFVVIVIAIVILSLIQLSFYRTSYVSKSQKIDELFIDLENKTRSILINEEIDSSKHLTFSFSKWGLYDVLERRIDFKDYHFQQNLILGYHIDTDKRKALYLQDTHSPVALAGFASLTGNVSLPKQGIKRGYVSGKGFYGDALVKGKVSESSTSLPRLCSEYSPIVVEKENIENIVGDSIGNSFYNKTLYYHSTDSIFLNKLKLIGKIVIESEKGVIISKNTVLKDVIIKAKDIVLEDHAKFRGQLIATNSIEISKGCEIEYPSALYIKTDSVSSSIVLKADSKVYGSIIYNTSVDKKDYSAAVKISPTAKVTGEIYTNKNLELEGEVSGMVITKKFVTHNKGGTYSNYLYDGRINSLSLEKEFLSITTQSNKKAIMKCLY